MPSRSLRQLAADTPLAQFLAEYGESRGWTKGRQAAKYLGVKQAAFSTWLRGEIEPGYEYQEQLAAATGKTLEFIADLVRRTKAIKMARALGGIDIRAEPATVRLEANDPTVLISEARDRLDRLEAIVGQGAMVIAPPRLAGTGTVTPPERVEENDPDLVDVWTYEGATLSGGQPFAMGQFAGSYRVATPAERGHEFQLFKVSGECMAPRIEAGDWVVVDTTRADDWRDGDTVAVAHEGALLVKRIELRESYPNKQAVLVAEDETRIVPDGDTRIIGVVVEIRKKP